MVNPKRSGNRPMPTEPERDRGRSSEPDASDAAPSGFRIADTLAAVMLLLATLTYLGRLMVGLSQPGDTIAPRDFGSLLASIIAIVAGILLVTGVKPPVARVTGALGAGALLLFNVANLTGGAVDDVIGKSARWAAIPIAATTFLAIVALIQASWTSVETVRTRADRDEDQDAPAPVAQTVAEPTPAPERPALPERSAPIPETLGVIGVPEADDEPAVPWQQADVVDAPGQPFEPYEHRPEPISTADESLGSYARADARSAEDPSTLLLPPHRPGPFGAPLNEGPAATDAVPYVDGSPDTTERHATPMAPQHPGPFGAPRRPDQFAPEPQTARSREAESFAGQELPSPVSRPQPMEFDPGTQSRTEPFISQPPHVETESEGEATSLLPRPTGPFGAPRREPLPPEPSRGSGYGPGAPEQYPGPQSNPASAIPERGPVVRDAGRPPAEQPAPDRREPESAAAQMSAGSPSQQPGPFGGPPLGYEHAETEGIPMGQFADHPTTVLPRPGGAADAELSRDGVIGAQPYVSPDTAPLHRQDYPQAMSEPRPPAGRGYDSEPAAYRPAGDVAPQPIPSPVPHRDDYNSRFPEGEPYRPESAPGEWPAERQPAPDVSRADSGTAVGGAEAQWPAAPHRRPFGSFEYPAEVVVAQDHNTARLPVAEQRQPGDHQAPPAFSAFEPTNQRGEGWSQHDSQWQSSGDGPPQQAAPTEAIPHASETSPIPTQHTGRQPMLRQPGGFLTPPPVDSEPIPAQQPPARHRGADDQPYAVPFANLVAAEPDSAPPPPDPVQAPPKRLSPMPQNDQQ
ncbi:hypothetical protein KO481_24165 [Nocardia sp. NEAU-G5]|uniref:Uncharacterized protein n=1 Tax=Nocardia albiluteola TaxID=2842303 RepID=A0ABS6B3C0_9NOCA|nr:hypothetical protein [Nocardia albiluteola]MBU3064613.1 hypothetical protein [Nocardia albiluteola]